MRILLLLSITGFVSSAKTCGSYKAVDVWNTGWKGEVTLPITKRTSQWELRIFFTSAITDINFWQGTTKVKSKRTKVVVKSFDWSSVNEAGSSFVIGFVANHDYNQVSTAEKIKMVICYEGENKCKTCQVDMSQPEPEPTPAPKPDPTTAPKPDPTPAPKPDPTPEPKPDPTTAPKPDPTPEPKPDPTIAPKPDPTPDPAEECDSSTSGYSKALHLSLLFYEAQRSGKLPADQRVTWRKDSALDDLIPGGYYDAGDYVKFGFPMAATTTMAAWGAVEYKSGFVKACEWENLKSMIKWATDYFIAAHTDTNEFVGQIGNGGLDHAYWGRPEDMTMERPAYKISASAPGSDLAGETAAALAAASIIFDEDDPEYAETCLQHAKELYSFANTYRGKYSDSIPDAANYYKSWNGYMDELAWGAVWLYRATDETSYLELAKQFAESLDDPSELSWDDKGAGVFILLASITKESRYIEKATSFCDEIFTDTPRTQDGLVFIQQWGSLRHASNVAFACLCAEDNGALTTSYRADAKRQIDYILGENSKEFNYQIGYGDSYPLRPHHASSSCPTTGPCGWDQFNSPDPNPQVLEGALVGGPKSNDDNSYTDSRQDYVTNEVTTDYNAGFQSALAALIA